MRARVVGRTYPSHTGHLPSHLSQRRPMDMPGCLRHMTRSLAGCQWIVVRLGEVMVRTHGWWRDMAGYGGCRDSKLCGMIARCCRDWRYSLSVAEGVAWSVVLLKVHR